MFVHERECVCVCVYVTNGYGPDRVQFVIFAICLRHLGFRSQDEYETKVLTISFYFMVKHIHMLIKANVI